MFTNIFYAFVRAFSFIFLHDTKLCILNYFSLQFYSLNATKELEYSNKGATWMTMLT